MSVQLVNATMSKCAVYQLSLSDSLVRAGPLGQCHPIPEDAQLKSQMRIHARNALKIHNAYNIPYEVEPGSDLDKAIKLHEKKQARRAETDEDETEAEQRRLERFARLQQKRRGGMRVCCRPCTLGTL